MVFGFGSQKGTKILSVTVCLIYLADLMRSKWGKKEPVVLTAKIETFRLIVPFMM